MTRLKFILTSVLASVCAALGLKTKPLTQEQMYFASMRSDLAKLWLRENGFMVNIEEHGGFCVATAHHFELPLSSGYQVAWSKQAGENPAIWHGALLAIEKNGWKSYERELGFATYGPTWDDLEFQTGKVIAYRSFDEPEWWKLKTGDELRAYYVKRYSKAA